MFDNKLNKTKISLMLNYIIVIFEVISFVILLTGYKFMFGVEPVLETSTIKMFRFFTIDANLLMGICSLIFIIQERKLLLGKIKEIPVKYYVIKLISTVSLVLTFLVVLLYLGRISKWGLMALYQNSNLFFHLVIPLLSIIAFVFFEKNNKIKLHYNLYSLIPIVLYAIYYIINVLIHMENGVVPKKYDWYYFVQGGINQAFIIVPLMFIITYIISIGLWFFNKIGSKEK